MEEMDTGLESSESGVSEGSSSEASSSEAGGGVAQAAPKQETETTPFHEHPRFKELVEQKNEALKRYQDMESRYKTIEQQVKSLNDSQPKAPSETDQLIADLKKVDPRLANVIESQLKASKTAEALQARLEAFENQSKESARTTQVQAAVAKINGMHESNKVSPEIKQILNDKFDLLYMQGKLSPNNLEQVYKEQYDSLKKYEDMLTRSIRESYVKSKTADASIPTSVPKGAPAKPAQKALNVPKDKEALKSAVVKSFMKEQAANRDATNN